MQKVIDDEGPNDFIIKQRYQNYSILYWKQSFTTNALFDSLEILKEIEPEKLPQSGSLSRKDCHVLPLFEV